MHAYTRDGVVQTIADFVLKHQKGLLHPNVQYNYYSGLIQTYIGSVVRQYITTHVLHMYMYMYIHVHVCGVCAQIASRFLQTWRSVQELVEFLSRFQSIRESILTPTLWEGHQAHEITHTSTDCRLGNEQGRGPVMILHSDLVMSVHQETTREPPALWQFP